MINANELRIGNWVTYGSSDQTTEQVYDIWFDVDEGVRYINDLIIDLIHPIPLTPEILIACGFEDRQRYYERDLDKDAYITWDWQDREIGIRSRMCHDKRGRDFQLWMPCDSLHQLQNLYFALTGTELIYSPGEQK